MQVGIHFMNFTLPGGPAGLRAAVGDTAVAAEEAGCTVFTAMDHWFQMEHFADAHDPMLEGYSVLNFVAAKTERLRLGLLVTGVTYRHPGLLAKTVTTLDVLSGGRAFLGIGAAWYEREHRALGVHYPPISERFERLEETIQICEQMWSDDEGPYNGKYYQLAETICVPPPLQTPRPPILIGGAGEKKTLRLVAQYADACNLFVTSPEETKRKLDILRGHCDAVGRDYDSIQKTILGRVDPAGDVTEFLSAMEQYAALGVSLVEVAPSMPDPARFVTLLGEKVVRPLASIG
jgi:F420-dependent oxidoreductase-like protein